MSVVAIGLAGLTLGALGSLHCAGMCGPLALACARAGGASHHAALRAGLYQVGRIATYAGLGVAFGWFGAEVNLLTGQAAASVIAGATVILVGVYGRRLERSAWWRGAIAGLGASVLERFGRATPLVFGAVNGLLPCGLVYTALAASLSLGHTGWGAWFMVAFGFATSPGLLLAGYLGSRGGRGRSAQILFPAASVLAGTLLIVRGLAAELPFAWANYLATHPVLGCH